MAEKLTIVYGPVVPSEVETSPDHKFLYGPHWQEEGFWLRPYHLDRLRSECLIDKGLPMAIVSRGLESDTQYNVLIFEDQPNYNSNLTLPELYYKTIGEPELYILILADLGNVADFHKTVTSNNGNLLLTGEEVNQLEAFARIRKVKDRKQLLHQVNGDFRASHPLVISRWKEEKEEGLSWLSKEGISQDFILDESFYKKVISKVIDNVILSSVIPIGGNVTTYGD